MASPRRDGITQEELKALLTYDPFTGEFRWNAARGHQKAGAVAGGLSDGYVAIGIKGRIYKAHRLAWLYVNGAWPREFIDHINGDRADNRLSNLREADMVTNLQNKTKPISSNKTSPYLGVCFVTKTSKWQASIGIEGRIKYLGQYPTAEEARDVYIAAKRKFHAGGVL